MLGRTINEQDKQQYGSQWKLCSGNPKAKEVRGQRSDGVGNLAWMSLSDSCTETQNSKVSECLESSWVKRVRPPWWPGSLAKEARKRTQFPPPCEDIARRCQDNRSASDREHTSARPSCLQNWRKWATTLSKQPRDTRKAMLSTAMILGSCRGQSSSARCCLLCRVVVPDCSCYTAAKRFPFAYLCLCFLYFGVFSKASLLTVMWRSIPPVASG